MRNGIILLTLFIFSFVGIGQAAWVETGSTMPDPPASTNDAIYLDGKIYVIGGFDHNAFVFNSKFRVYDPFTNTWTTETDAPILPGRLRGDTDGTKLYFLSYIDNLNVNEVVKIYDPASKGWSDGVVMVGVEGMDVVSDPTTARFYAVGAGAATYIYDPVTDTFEADTAAMPSLLKFGCAGIFGGDILVGGGSDTTSWNFPAIAPVEYSISGESWTTLTPVIPEPVIDAGCVQFDEGVILSGGRNIDWTDSTVAVQMFENSKGTWTDLDDLPVALSGPWSVVVDNYLFVGGGFNGTNVANVLTWYNKLANADPVITSTEITEVVVGDLYEYDVEAEDSDFMDVLEYDLLEGPTDIDIDINTGLITWDSTGAALGDYEVSINVTDGDGGLAEQEYFLTVVEATDDDDAADDDDAVDDDDDAADDDDDAADDDDADDDSEDDDDAADDDTTGGGGDDDDDDEGCCG